jgi:hypothetical protein
MGNDRRSSLELYDYYKPVAATYFTSVNGEGRPQAYTAENGD